MEFLDHSEFLGLIAPLGVRERDHSGSVRFTLDPDAGAGLEPTSVVFAAEGEGVVRVGADALPGVVEGVIHKEHLAEVALCPARAWGPIVDLVAFDLAGDERWDEIDAEVALHLRTRDPLALGSEDHRLIRRILSAILEHGEPGEHDLSVVAVGAPIVMNLEQAGRLTVWCGNRAIADVVSRLVQPRAS